MKFYEIKKLGIILKNNVTGILVREEINEYNEKVLDIRYVNKNNNEKWHCSKSGLTFPAKFKNELIEILQKTSD